MSRERIDGQVAMKPLPEGPVVPDRMRGSRLLQTFLVVAMLALIVIAMMTFS